MSTQVNPSDSFKSFLKDFMTGGLSGAVTVAALQPMIYYKNLSQARSLEQAGQSSSSTKITWNPRVWYRGAGGFAASFAPTIALQTAANSVFSNWVSPLAAACLSGAFSSIVVNPAELIMVQQQRTGSSFAATLKTLARTGGIRVFFRGLPFTAGREATFTGAYLGSTPHLKEKFQKLGAGPGPAHVAAAVISGLFAALFSQAMDTHKTRIMRDLNYQEKFTRMLFTKEAFAGIGWRFAMIVTATTALPLIQEKIKKAIEN